MSFMTIDLSSGEQCVEEETNRQDPRGDHADKNGDQLEAQSLDGVPEGVNLTAVEAWLRASSQRGCRRDGEHGPGALSFLDIPKGQREPGIEADRVADDF
jgi:hypothetical protein